MARRFVTAILATFAAVAIASFAGAETVSGGEGVSPIPVSRRHASIIEPSVQESSGPGISRLPATPSPLASIPNVLVNDPSGESFLHGNTQMEPSVAVSGDTVLCVFTDSKGFYVSGTLTGCAVSFDGGATWSDRGSLPRAGSVDQVYGDATILTDGAGHWYCISIYDVGNGSGGNPGDLGLVLHTGHFLGTSLFWSAPRLIAGGHTGDAPDSPHSTLDVESDRIYVAYSNLGTGFAWGQVEVVTLADHGATNLYRTIVQPRTPAVNNAGPRVAVGPNGEVYCAWESGYLTGNGQGPATIKVSRSIDHGASFQIPVVAGSVNESWYSGPPGFNREEEFVEFPSLAVDRSSGPQRGRVYLVWHDAVIRKFEGDLTPVFETFMDNDTPQGAQALPATSSRWQIDGSLIGDDWVDWYRFPGLAGDHLRFVLRGNSLMQVSTRLYCHPVGAWSDTLLTASMRGLGDPAHLLFTLPQDGDYWLAVERHVNTGSYTGYLRRSTSTDPSVATDHRDVVLISSADGVGGWTPKIRINDDAGPTDQVFPEVVVDGDGGVHVAWYDRRFDPGCRALADLVLASSADGGVTFAPNLRLTQQSSFWQVPADAVPNFGDVFHPRAEGDRLFEVWADGRLGSPDVMIAPLRTGFATAHPETLRAFVGQPLNLDVTVQNQTPYDDALFDVHIDSDRSSFPDTTLVVGPLGSGATGTAHYAPIVKPWSGLAIAATLDIQVTSNRSAHVHTSDVFVLNDQVEVRVQDVSIWDAADGTHLDWRATGASGFHVERGEAPDGPFARLTTLPLAPAEGSSHYRYVDAARHSDSRLWYRVVALEAGGRVTSFGPWVAEAQAPRAVTLLGAQPNPFNPTTAIRFELPRTAAVVLRILDVRGRVVATLLDGVLRGSGRHAVLWDGHDARGALQPSGVYVAELRALGVQRASRIVMLR